MGRKMTSAELFGGQAIQPEPRATKPRRRMSTRDLMGGENQVVRAKTPEFESFLRGAAQGGSLGYIDELTGALEGARDVTVGDYNVADLLDRYRARRDESRVNYGAAEQDNPWSYGGGQIAGGLATTAIPGMNFAKGASALSKIGTAAKLGGAVGVGTSEQDLTKGKIGGVANDAFLGAALGGGLQGGLTAAGKVVGSMTPRFVAKKAGNIFLNTPEELTEKYIKDPKAIKGAEKIYQVGEEFRNKALPELKKLAVEGSAASRALLAKEGSSIPRAKVAGIYNAKAEQIADKFEGAISDPQALAAYKAFKTQAKLYQTKVDPTTGRELAENLSTNRIKSELQALDRMVEFKTAPGTFSKVDDVLKKDVRRTIDEELKRVSPEYAKLMPEVAADTELLGKATDLAKSESGFTNLFKRLSRDKSGAGQLPRKTLEKIDKRLGTDYVQRAENAMIKQAFDSSITNGSMNVNKFAAMLRDVPIIKYVAPLVGATVDKYGRKLTLLALDHAQRLHRMSESATAKEVMKKLQPLIATAQAGNKASAITLLMFQRANPNFDYGKIKAEREGMNE